MRFTIQLGFRALLVALESHEMQTFFIFGCSSAWLGAYKLVAGSARKLEIWLGAFISSSSSLIPRFLM